MRALLLVATILMAGCTVPLPSFAKDAARPCRESPAPLVFNATDGGGLVTDPDHVPFAFEAMNTEGDYLTAGLTSSPGSGQVKAGEGAHLANVTIEQVREWLSAAGLLDARYDETVGSASLARLPDDAFAAFCAALTGPFQHVPERDADNGCADGGTLAATAATTQGTHHVEIYCGGSTAAARAFSAAVQAAASAAQAQARGA